MAKKDDKPGARHVDAVRGVEIEESEPVCTKCGVPKRSDVSCFDGHEHEWSRDDG